MRFHASVVSASVSGDYYQLYLGPEEYAEDDPFEVAGDIVRARDNHVSCALDASTFEDVRRVAEVIFGLREPDEGDALF